ncbi:DNA/RNA helicase domain-containing protein [Chitinophaga sp.]|uniref:DNA/RNA helicase domain-containing protein n=1 Tax=Chitinophaga sp. TaxID=1869181 RepID=UPI0031E1FD63
MINPQHYAIKRLGFNQHAIKELADDPFTDEFWPVVYLLKEKDKKKALAYVGETYDVTTRLTTHLSHPEKSKLQEAYLISSKKFNKSATLDIEAYCIKYLAGDGKYKLLNGNLGISDHNYYQKEELYYKIFESIWEDFRSLGIASQELSKISNSALFKYSPYKTLDPEQTKSLIMILESLLDDRYERIVIEGGAGSGKTVLAVFLFKLLHTPAEDFNFSVFGEEDLKIVELVRLLKQKTPNPSMALVIPVDPFRSTVKKIFGHVEGLNADMVIGPAELSRKHYDIVLVDEAHRLRRRENLGSYFGGFDRISSELGFDKMKNDELDWVIKQSDKSIFFYDEFQSVKPSDVLQERFDMLKNDSKVKNTFLNSQFRVKGGLKYVRFIDGLLAGNPGTTKKMKWFKKYDFWIFHDLEQMITHIKEKNNKEQLARVVAGFAWPWASKKDKGAVDIKIGNLELKWNSPIKDWINSANAINEVGCIHTVQGYDLNYTGIIFGNEIGYDKEKGEIIIRKENYHDRNGKNGVKNPEQLKNFIVNIYKTLMLRGIKGTYVYVCDEALREYFTSHILSYDEMLARSSSIDMGMIRVENSVPLINLKAAAGAFSEVQQFSEEQERFPVQDGLKISDEHFACLVVGESMNKIIPNGAICLFRKYTGGSRQEKVVLVSHTSIQDADFGSGYTVKKYFSEKILYPDGTWSHDRIILRPLSTDMSYKDIVLEGDELTSLRVIGIFEQVLTR